MAKKSKIYLAQNKMNPKTYTVVKLSNRLVPECGSQLKREEVEKLMREIDTLDVEVVEKK